jgi:hypothetical protein
MWCNGQLSSFDGAKSGKGLRESPVVACIGIVTGSIRFELAKLTTAERDLADSGCFVRGGGRESDR